MKSLIAIFSTVVLMAGAGASNAHADNFFTKLGKSIKKAHNRHVDMLENAHERHVDMLRHVRIHAGQRGYGEGRGHYETVEVRQWVEGSWDIQYVEVRDPGHYEFREVTEIVTPARCEKVYVQPVYRCEIDRCGREVKVMVKCGYWTTREIPAVTVTKCVKVWVDGECRKVAKKVWCEGHYETRCVRVWVCD